MIRSYCNDGEKVIAVATEQGDVEQEALIWHGGLPILILLQRSNDEAALDITMLMGDTRVQHSLGLPRAGVIRCRSLNGQHRQID